MELQLLRFQLDPHFLFNTLNGIVSEIPPHPGTAMEMVGELSSYLRYSLDHRHQLLTKLAVELDAIQAYLRIQQARFGKRLETSIEATHEARESLVPSFLLQPLVENAFKHGFAPDASMWTLQISAAIQDGRLRVEVINTGELDTHGGAHGVGLDTIRRRLEIHYPNRHRFDIRSKESLVTATLEMEGAPCSV
jgi:LytS/YehU family sensor histidine kinase